LTKDWQDEATAFNKRSLADTDYVYLWVDGIHLEVRLEQDKVCLLVMIGVRADGTKELVALTDGHRESSEPEPGSRRASWSNVPTNQEAISKSHDTPIRRS
jgi:transposase-like protein